jgi:hypothetical protein
LLYNAEDHSSILFLATKHLLHLALLQRSASCVNACTSLKFVDAQSSGKRWSESSTISLLKRARLLHPTVALPMDEAGMQQLQQLAGNEMQ